MSEKCTFAIEKHRPVVFAFSAYQNRLTRRTDIAEPIPSFMSAAVNLLFRLQTPLVVFE